MTWVMFILVVFVWIWRARAGLKPQAVEAEAEAKLEEHIKQLILAEVRKIRKAPEKCFCLIHLLRYVISNPQLSHSFFATLTTLRRGS